MKAAINANPSSLHTKCNHKQLGNLINASVFQGNQHQSNNQEESQSFEQRLINQPVYYYPQSQMQSPPLTSYDHNHNHNLFCFLYCSNWTLYMNSFANKKELNAFACNGKLAPDYMATLSLASSTPQDITGYLPIDLSKNQRFVLDPQMLKINLNLLFDFNGQMNNFTTVTHCYSLMLFEIKLIGELHGMQLLKDPIDFKVKGYDIHKTIIGVLNYHGTKASSVIYRDQVMTVFYGTVFSNVQCSFSVEFYMSNHSLSRYYNERLTQQFSPIGDYGIVIKKLKVVYCLPLCVFSKQNYKGVIPKSIMMPVYNNKELMDFSNQQLLLERQKQSGVMQCEEGQIINKVSEITVKPKKKGCKLINNNSNGNGCLGLSLPSFCNWHLFMTYTTPFIFDVSNLNINTILNGFIKPSLFGIKCLFQADKNNYTEVNYFPSLSSISILLKNKDIPTDINPIEVHDAPSSQGNKKPKQTLQSPSSANSSLNSLEEDSDNTNQSTVSLSPTIISKAKTIFHSEDIKEISNIKNFNKQTSILFKSTADNDISLETLTLNDLLPESQFSITWTPYKTFETKALIGINNNTIDTNPSIFPSIKIYYKFREDSFTNKGRFLPVIGLLEKTIRGKTIRSCTDDHNLHDFWFNTHSSPNELNQVNKSNVMPQAKYYSLIEEGCKIDLKEQHL